LAFAFLRRFPNALQMLGYESDNSWIVDLDATGTNDLTSVLKRLVAQQWETFAALAKSSLSL